MRRSEPGPRGGKLNRAGRPRGAKSLVSRTFEEFAKATLDDPEIQDRIRKRLLEELAGKKRNPLPALAALAAASVREKPLARGGTSIVFVAQITNGHGEVKRIEIGNEAPALAAEKAPVAALPASPGEE